MRWGGSILDEVNLCLISAEKHKMCFKEVLFLETTHWQ